MRIHVDRQDPTIPAVEDSAKRVHEDTERAADDPGFTNVVMSARWKNCAGEIQQEVRKSLILYETETCIPI